MSSPTQHRNSGFTLVEILIDVVILGILAAVVIPQFTNASESARSSSLLTQLQTLRSQIELYQVQHNGDYPDFGHSDGTWAQMTSKTTVEGSTEPDGDYGPYLQQEPVNPFTESANVAGTPTEDGSASDSVGWVWQDGILYAVVPDTKEELFDNDGDGVSDNENVKVTGSNSTK